VTFKENGVCEPGCFMLYVGKIMEETSYVYMSDHSGRAVRGTNRLRSLGRWYCEFESNSRHGCLCVRLFCVCVVLFR
jgi:hypothetical protein